MKKLLTAAVAAASLVGAGALAIAATPAAAQHRDFHGGRTFHRGGGRGGRTSFGVFIGAPYGYGYYDPYYYDYGYPYDYGYGYCRWRLRWNPYYGRYVRVRVCY